MVKASGKMVPELRFPGFKGSWDDKRLGEITQFKRGFDLPNSERRGGQFPIISSGGYSGLHDEYKIEGPGIVTGRYGSIGEIYYIEENHWPLNTSLWVEDFHGNDKKFSFYLLQTINFSIFSDKTGVPGVNRNDLHTIKSAIPDQKEQQKIATFLSSIDEKLTKLRRKRELLETYKRGVMQKIFSQELRFKKKDGGDYPNWEKRYFGDVFVERSERGNGDLELLSVKTDGGIVKRSEIEGKNNASEDRSNYKRVLPDDIAYNSMRMWQGASGLSKYDGIVSPAYTVITTKEGNSPRFFSYLFKYPHLIFLFRRFSQGLTSDTWNLKFPAFSRIQYVLPVDKNEQEKIADFFEFIDRKLEELDEKVSQIETFKQGLLQKLFV